MRTRHHLPLRGSAGMGSHPKMLTAPASLFILQLVAAGTDSHNILGISEFVNRFSRHRRQHPAGPPSTPRRCARREAHTNEKRAEARFPV